MINLRRDYTVEILEPTFPTLRDLIHPHLVNIWAKYPFEIEIEIEIVEEEDLVLTDILQEEVIEVDILQEEDLHQVKLSHQ